MNALVKEWLRKAEGDWHTANRELRIRKNPNFDAVCFHAQQCAEKYLKAFLQQNGQHFPKTHNLTDLLELAIRYDRNFELYRDMLEALNKFSVLFRYPGEEANRRDAKLAVNHADKIRTYTQEKLAEGFS